MFSANASKLDSALGYHPMWHILNSAGIERFPRYQYDWSVSVWEYTASAPCRTCAEARSLSEGQNIAD